MGTTQCVEPTHQDLAMPKLAPLPFSRAGWIFEFKYDGFRVLAGYSHGKPQLISRLGTDLLPFFPEVSRGLQLLHVMAPIALDGELVILDRNGRPQIDRLRRRPSLRGAESIEHASRTEPAMLAVYDLLVVGGKDIRARPLARRKDCLVQSITNATTRIFSASHLEEHGEALCKFAGQRKIKSIVAKCAQSPYLGGYASGWLKINTAPSSSPSTFPLPPTQ